MRPSFCRGFSYQFSKVLRSGYGSAGLPAHNLSWLGQSVRWQDPKLKMSKISGHFERGRNSFTSLRVISNN
jgi:hypothetical protein